MGAFRTLRLVSAAWLLAVALVIAGLTWAGTLTPTAAGANPVQPDHPSLVPVVPETGYPVILNTPTSITFEGNCRANGCEQGKQTFAVNLVGNYLVSGGDFQNIRLQNGSVVNNPHLAVFDTTTKQLVCRDLVVDDEVLVIVPGPDPNSIIIGGRFRRIISADGVDRARNRTAKIDLDTCNVDRNWNIGPVSSRVDEMAVSGNRLFIGGSFTKVDGLPIEKLAEINYTTGEVNPNFSLDFTVYSPIAGLGASPDGTRLGIIHRDTSIEGVALRGTAIVDISGATPRLTPHRMRSSAAIYNNYDKITDGAVAPDFSALVIAGGARTAADYITKIPAVDSPNQFAWQHYMRDSNFAVAVSNNAVYAGGHFCFIESGPGATQVLSPNTGPSECTGSEDFNTGAWRSQIAALDLNDGTPLNWNPGSNSGRGVGALTVVPRGLLIGHDGFRVNQRLVGATAFLDFGATEPPPPPPPPEGQTCTATAVGNSIELSWTAIAGEDTYVVRRNGRWLTTVRNGGLSFVDSNAPANASYIIRSERGGTTTNTTCTGGTPPPAGGQTCTVVDNGNGTVRLSWSAIAGENTYVVRRNDRWVSTESGLTITTPGSTADSFIIRSRMAGTTTNTACS